MAAVTREELQTYGMCRQQQQGSSQEQGMEAEVAVGGSGSGVPEGAGTQAHWQALLLVLLLAQSWALRLLVLLLALQRAGC